MVESSTAEKAVTEPTPAEATAPELATAELVELPVPSPAKEEPKPADVVPSDPAVAPAVPVAEDSKATDDEPKVVERAAFVQTEIATGAASALTPVEASGEPAPADKTPLESTTAPVAAAEVVSVALKPNGTATNGATTVSKEQEDVEMKDIPAASPSADTVPPAPSAPAPSAPAAPAAEAAEKSASGSPTVGQPAEEPEGAAVPGEKRKAADEEPAAENNIPANSKKAKLDGATTQAEPTQNAPDPAPTAETASANVSSTTEERPAGAPAPRKAGRPRKTQKEKAPVSPVGRTLRKTRSQGPVEV